MSWINGDNRNLFLKFKPKLRLYHVVLTTPKKISRKSYTDCSLNATIARYWKTDSREELSRLKWTIYIGRRIVCVNLKTDTDKLNIVVYRSGTVNTSKIRRLVWSWQNTSHSWQNEFIYWATLTTFTSGALYWMKQLFFFQTTFVKNGCSYKIDFFWIIPRT